MECQLAPGANLREYPAQEYPVQSKTRQSKTRHDASAIPNLGRGGASSLKTASCCLQRAPKCNVNPGSLYRCGKIT